VHLSLPFYEVYGLSLRGWLQSFREKSRTRAGWKLFTEGDARVIAVSEYAKQEVVNNLGFDDSDVHAIHHGVDISLFRSDRPSPLVERYLLHVSSYQPKKNLRRIIRAYSSVTARDKPVLYILSPGFDGVSGEDGVVIDMEPRTHEQLVAYYKNATAFLFPSLHETFGMPILEAMSAGCPVITSGTTACAEIASDAAILVNPRSSAEITKAIERILDDGALRESLSAKGYARASSFTWEKSAREHMEVFRYEIDNKYNRVFWNRRYKECLEVGSGPGSRGYSKWYKSKLLSDVIRERGVRTVLDIGCGDMEVVSYRPLSLEKYTGIDVSSHIIKRNSAMLYEGLADSVVFQVHDMARSRMDISCDMVICLDVLIHQLNENLFENLLDNMMRIDAKLFLISYQMQPGRVSSDYPSDLESEAKAMEDEYRKIDMKHADIKRGEVSWFGELDSIINKRYQGVTVNKIGEYRGQAMYLVLR
jgi:2-polyprenyl-3-methyl-5-hydroxy-6-metoxy-1,4-benzoquinol methylase